MIELLLQDGRLFPLKDGVYTIGRSAKCNIRIIEDSVSRVHCTIKVEESLITIIDGDYLTGLLSSNGIGINKGLRLSPLTGRELNHNDEVTLIPSFTFKIFKKQDDRTDPDSTLL